MSPRTLRLYSALVGAGFASAASLLAQASPDLVAPKVRDKVVSDAARVVASLDAPVSLPDPLPNPFIAREAAPEPAPVTEAPAPVVAIAPADSIEFLGRLAAQIPATGTVNLGGEAILLLGQKKLKVGDPYTISFEGQSYDVSIAAITSTAFTVKRGEILFSRPIRLTGSPTTPLSSRP